MARSKAEKRRRQKIREGRLDPGTTRREWQRKPITQIVMNKKAEQRRSYCRNDGDDLAAPFFMFSTA